MRAEAFLAAARVARLATVSADGSPHVVPVVYAIRGRRIYIALDEKSKRVAPLRLRRVRNITAEPRVSLLVDRYGENWRRLAWVRVDGVARILHRGKTHALAIALLRAKYRQYRKMDLEARPIVEIVVRRVVSWEEQEK